MMSFKYYVPTRVVFGLNKCFSVGSILSESCVSGPVLLVADSGSWLKPLLSEIIGNLERSGFNAISLFDQISPNPKLSECDKGLQFALKEKTKIVIAVGGGSILDAAKKIAKDSQADYFINIPTTAGTGSHINEWSVLLDDHTNEKISLQNVAANLAILDPLATSTMPPHITLFTGLDSFSHGMEAFFGNGASVLTDIQALKGCSLIVENIEIALEDGLNLEARARMLEADLLTGCAMLNAGLGILHCLANVVPGFYPHYAHGQLCGSLIKSTADYNREALPSGRAEQIMPLVDQAWAIHERYTEMLGLEKVVIEGKNLEMIKSYGASNVNADTNPRKVTPEGLELLCREAFTIK